MMMRVRTLVYLSLFLAAILAAAPATAQDLTFEATVDFAFVQKQALEGAAGEVTVSAVEFMSSTGSGGFMKKTFSSDDPDLQAGIVTRLVCSTEADVKWKVDFIVEFLDEDGNVIDRARNNGSLKNQTKNFEFGHTTLKWALQHIKQARVVVKAEGKK